MGRTIEELDKTMTLSEYEGWAEYFNTHPSIQEQQMGALTYMVGAQSGAKDLTPETFMVTKTQDESTSGNITDMTEEEINAIVGA